MLKPIVIILGLVTCLIRPDISTADTNESNASNEVSVNLNIKMAGIFVDDQEKAKTFYTEKLGFEVKNEIPIGEFKWLTVVASENPEGTELLLEPNSNPAAKTFQKAMYDQGIPATMFFVEDINIVFAELKKRGVTFTMEPTTMGTTTLAIFDDTCGNLIQIAQVEP